VFPEKSELDGSAAQTREAPGSPSAHQLQLHLTQPQETYEQGEKKPPVHSTEEKLPIVAKKGPR